MHRKSQIAATITGVGSYLPERVLTNADLEKMVETSDEWIVTRTGIRERHIAAENETTSDMAARAAERAMKDAGIEPGDVDLIIVATVTADMTFPSTAWLVQEKIGAKKAFCFDLSAACSGFLFSLETARQYISSGFIKTALVIGAEKMSCITDWQDRTTCVLFGDGAGAVVVQGATTGRGIIASAMGSDGSLAELLNVPGGGCLHPASEESLKQRLHFIKMSGNEVFKHAVRRMHEVSLQTLEKAGISMDSVSMVIPHQANMRIIKAIGDRFGAAASKVYVNVDRVGNISSASIPVALDEAIRNGKVNKGDIILCMAFGGGFTWGATVMEWGK